MKQLSSDVGGTFVDVVLWDSTTNSVHVDKLPSTRHSADGIIAAIAKVSADSALSPSEIARFVHGFTIATNAWLERRGARLMFLTTKGFRDVLEIGTQRRPSLYSLRQARRAPLVQRSMVVEVDERIDSFGEVATHLTDQEIVRVIEVVRAAKPDAVALAFLFSYLNPRHEQRLVAALKAALPDVEVYPSYRINPEIEEYHRAYTTATAAYVGPAVRDYIASLRDGLDRLGLKSLMLMRSDGGIATPTATLANPGTMLLSGPAGGVIAAEALGATIGVGNLVTFDMGGTSADFSLIVEGRASRSRARSFGEESVRIPMIDIATIAAGGGSIAAVDHAGALTVGPQSAGAQPGPACYGRGGTRPTLTDATLVLGMLDPNDFAGGNVKLDVAAACQAINKHIAKPLELLVEDAAIGMISIANAQMRQAIRALTIERGYDIRKFSLTAFGGAGAIFASLMQPDLDVAEVLIPPRPGVFAALGLLMSDIRHNAQISSLLPLRDLDTCLLKDRLASLSSDLHMSLGTDNVPERDREITFAADMRYVGQFHNLTIPITEDVEAERLISDFHEAHSRVYGYANRENAMEIVSLRAAGRGMVEKAAFARAQATTQEPSAPLSSRPIRFPGSTADVNCPIWSRDQLAPGHTIHGPAVITQSDTTILILPSQTARVDDWAVLHITTAKEN